ncbi:MAG: class I SAM-dependent methyltransferase [Candidatus Levybacteria bacterium]|nr:class I SAM-dependent methyltransferase [Candidatus Levybacteria bacterium]
MECVLGHNNIKEELFNDIPMYCCISCRLVWRQTFDVPIARYEDKEIRVYETKINDRLANSLDRIKTIRKYVDLNNICDIGSGEGAFLNALAQFGYTNSVGIEPSNKSVEFAVEHGLCMENGTIEDVARVVAKYNLHTFTMFHLIEHLPNPLVAVQKLFNIMQQKDKLVIETPNFDSYVFHRVNYKHNLICSEHLFYFNENNLQLLLEKVGFSVVVHGKRDFYGLNSSIRTFLFKLRFGKMSGHRNANDANNVKLYFTNESNFKRKDSINIYANLINVFKKSVRLVLRKLVHLLGREDYMWFVVQKL